MDGVSDGRVTLRPKAGAGDLRFLWNRRLQPVLETQTLKLSRSRREPLELRNGRVSDRARWTSTRPIWPRTSGGCSTTCRSGGPTAVTWWPASACRWSTSSRRRRTSRSCSTCRRGGRLHPRPVQVRRGHHRRREGTSRLHQARPGELSPRRAGLRTLRARGALNVAIDAAKARARLANGELRVVLPRLKERRGGGLLVPIEHRRPGHPDARQALDETPVHRRHCRPPGPRPGAPARARAGGRASGRSGDRQR